MVRLIVSPAPFLYYGLTGFVIDPVEENRRFLMMVDVEFQRFFTTNPFFLVLRKIGRDFTSPAYFPCQMRLSVKGNDFRVFRNALVEAAKNVLFAV